MLPALRSPQPVFEAERHSAASKLSLCPGGTHDAKNVRNRMIVTDCLRSSYIDQMAQKSWKHVKLNCQHSYDCWFLWPSTVLAVRVLLVDWRCLCLRIQVLWQLQSCSVQDGPPLHLFCPHPGGCYAPAQRNWADSKSFGIFTLTQRIKRK